jgi:lysyl-tRNA synthetase class I
MVKFMGDQKTRESTSNSATEKINQMLTDNDYTSALLLASIYVDMRARTLITLQLNPPEGKFESISNILSSEVGFRRLINICELLGKIEHDEAEALGQLYGKRNKVAHATKLWKEVSEEEQAEITRLCNVAIKFLEKTTNLEVKP